MKFLIPTEPDDTHVIVVKIALEKRGHSVRLLFPSDQPMQLKHSILIDNDTYLWRSTDKSDSIVDNDYDVVWCRRACKPHLPKDSTHPGDYPFVVHENTLFYDSLTYNIAPKARWVNNKEASARAGSKLLQLKQAVQCGMSIPTTLCSNDPQDIRYFLLKHESEGVVYQPLSSHAWLEQQRIKRPYTTKLSFLDLPCNKSLQLTPGIFQKEIKKMHYIRVLYLSGYMISVISSTDIRSLERMDWKSLSDSDIHVELYQLPGYLEQQIQMLMRNMGLLFAGLNFIVNDDHEYIFTDLDEQAAFLWMESLNPEIKILDIFISFLLDTSKKFRWRADNNHHRLDEYQQDMLRVLEKNGRRNSGWHQQTSSSRANLFL